MNFSIQSVGASETHPAGAFYFSLPAPPQIYTLSLHDALPICEPADFQSVQVRPLWAGHYRVNVLVGGNAAMATVAHSYFLDRKSTRLNSSHSQISYAVFCLKKKIDASETQPAGARNVSLPPPP